MAEALPEDPTKPPTIHGAIGVSRPIVALPMMAAIGAGLYFLESIFPWQKDSGVSLAT